MAGAPCVAGDELDELGQDLVVQLELVGHHLGS